MITKKQSLPFIIILVQCFTMCSISFSQPARLISSGGPARPSGGDTLFQDDCGIVWDEPILLSDTAFDAHSPKIALSGDDTVHVVWESEKPSLRLPYVRSVDGGRIFENVVDLLIDSITFRYPTRWNHITSKDNNVYVFSLGGTGTNTPIHMNLSSDRGTTWTASRNINNDTVTILQSVSINYDTLALVVAKGYRRILRSTDGGETWTRTNEDLSVYSKIALTPSALHLVYERVINSAFEIEYRISTDLGTTWKSTEVLSTVDGIWSDVALIGSNGDSIVQVIWREAKYGCLGILGCSIASRTGITKAGSTTWLNETILTEQPRGYPEDVTINNKIRAVAWSNEIVTNEIFHTVTRISNDSTFNVWCSEVDHTPQGIGEITGISIALSSKSFHIVWSEYFNNRDRVFYRRGVFVTTDVKEEKETIPTDFSLSQNYPNPFNQSTIINYQLSKEGIVNLKIYDIFGREIKTLVNERKEAGKYEVVWAAGELASGVYFIRMSAGEYISTTKAILMK